VTSGSVMVARSEARVPSPHAPRLVLAETLKLRKRRGLVALTMALTVGIVVVFYAILAILHAVNPAHHGPAGGVDNLGHGMAVLASLGGIAAVIVGAVAGTGDLGAGVFRELVVTGRSRRALFAARIPGGLAFLLPLVAVAFAVAAGASVLFAGSLAAPSTALLAECGAWIVLVTSFDFALALGVASLIGSRTISTVVVIAWRNVLAPVLLAISFLGVAREGLPNAAAEHLLPGPVAQFLRQGHGLEMSASAAVATLVVWTVVALAAGTWRTQTRDA
jgi:hypothetical protein